MTGLRERLEAWRRRHEHRRAIRGPRWWLTFVGGAAAAGALLAAAVVVESGREDPGSAGGGAPAFARMEIGGDGARGVVVFTPTRAAADPPPAVVFLHGWGATDPRGYGAWIEHLARAGYVVIFPRYQEPPFDNGEDALADAMVGVRLALNAVEVDREVIVAAGHSAGGALAADYAAAWREEDVPRPQAVFSVYPVRTVGDDVRVPEADPGRIAADTSILALAGERDEVAGARWARRLVREADRVPRPRRIFRFVRQDEVDGHDGPRRTGRVAREVFWDRLDALVAEAAEGS